MAFLVPLLALDALERRVSEDPCSCASRDPHISLANGGHADFRGKDGQFYNFLSDSALSVNAMTQSSVFTLGQTTVNGTFINEIGIVAKSGVEDTLFKLSVDADKFTENLMSYNFAEGLCDNEKVTLGPKSQKACGDTQVSIEYSTLTMKTPEWKVTVAAQPVFDRISGPSHRLDISFESLKLDEDHLPHGIIGQSFDGSGIPRFGRLDQYPDLNIPGEFTTSAMAEGAIEGVAADYEVAHKYATSFKFGRF